jgi:hypothetical protein
VNETTLEVLQALGSDGNILRSDVLRWMSDRDLETRALVYELTRNAWSRITPELSMNEQCSFMGEYLLECIAANRQNEDHIHSGFEAAWELAAWLKHLQPIKAAEPVIRKVVRDLENLYRSADEKTQNRIETGAVEHMIESRPLRKYFSHWRDDPELKAAYEACLAWGEAHES